MNKIPSWRIRIPFCQSSGRSSRRRTCNLRTANWLAPGLDPIAAFHPGAAGAWLDEGQYIQRYELCDYELNLEIPMVLIPAVAHFCIPIWSPKEPLRSLQGWWHSCLSQISPWCPSLASIRCLRGYISIWRWFCWRSSAGSRPSARIRAVSWPRDSWAIPHKYSSNRMYAWSTCKELQWWVKPHPLFLRPRI